MCVMLSAAPAFWPMLYAGGAGNASTAPYTGFDATVAAAAKVRVEWSWSFPTVPTEDTPSGAADSTVLTVRRRCVQVGMNLLGLCLSQDCTCPQTTFQTPWYSHEHPLIPQVRRRADKSRGPRGPAL